MEKRNKRIRSVEDMEGFQEYAEKVGNFTLILDHYPFMA